MGSRGWRPKAKGEDWLYVSDGRNLSFCLQLPHDKSVRTLTGLLRADGECVQPWQHLHCMTLDERKQLIVHSLGAHDEPETADEISLGHMYEHGDSVPQDYWTALHWYQLAAATRDTAVEAGVQ